MNSQATQSKFGSSSFYGSSSLIKSPQAETKFEPHQKPAYLFLHSLSKASQNQLPPICAINFPSELAKLQVNEELNYALALDTEGQIYSWGSLTENTNNKRRLSLLSPKSQQNQSNDQKASEIQNLLSGTSPSYLNYLEGRKITQLSCVLNVAHIISEDGVLYSWGLDEMRAGILGHGRQFEIKSPKPCNHLIEYRIKSVSVCETHASCVDHQGKLFTWGTSTVGALGLDTQSQALIPSLITKTKLLNIKSVHCNSNYTAFCSNGGYLFYYGIIGTGLNRRNSFDSSRMSSSGGLSARNKVSTITQVISLSDEFVVKVRGGTDYLLALTKKGNLYYINSELESKLLNFNDKVNNFSYTHNLIYGIHQSSKFNKYKGGGGEEGDYMYVWRFVQKKDNNYPILKEYKYKLNAKGVEFIDTQAKAKLLPLMVEETQDQENPLGVLVYKTSNYFISLKEFNNRFSKLNQQVREDLEKILAQKNEDVLYPMPIEALKQETPIKHVFAPVQNTTPKEVWDQPTSGGKLTDKIKNLKSQLEDFKSDEKQSELFSAHRYSLTSSEEGNLERSAHKSNIVAKKLGYVDEDDEDFQTSPCSERKEFPSLNQDIDSPHLTESQACESIIKYSPFDQQRNISQVSKSRYTFVSEGLTQRPSRTELRDDSILSDEDLTLSCDGEESSQRLTLQTLRGQGLGYTPNHHRLGTFIDSEADEIKMMTDLRLEDIHLRSMMEDELMTSQSEKALNYRNQQVAISQVQKLEQSLIDIAEQLDQYPDNGTAGGRTITSFSGLGPDTVGRKISFSQADSSPTIRSTNFNNHSEILYFTRQQSSDVEVGITLGSMKRGSEGYVRGDTTPSIIGMRMTQNDSHNPFQRAGSLSSRGSGSGSFQRDTVSIFTRSDKPSETITISQNPVESPKDSMMSSTGIMQKFPIVMAQSYSSKGGSGISEQMRLQNAVRLIDVGFKRRQQLAFNSIIRVVQLQNEFKVKLTLLSQVFQSVVKQSRQRNITMAFSSMKSERVSKTMILKHKLFVIGVKNIDQISTRMALKSMFAQWKMIDKMRSERVIQGLKSLGKVMRRQINMQRTWGMQKLSSNIQHKKLALLNCQIMKRVLTKVLKSALQTSFNKIKESMSQNERGNLLKDIKEYHLKKSCFSHYKSQLAKHQQQKETLEFFLSRIEEADMMLKYRSFQRLVSNSKSCSALQIISRIQSQFIQRQLKSTLGKIYNHAILKVTIEEKQAARRNERLRLRAKHQEKIELFYTSSMSLLANKLVKLQQKQMRAAMLRVKLFGRMMGHTKEGKKERQGVDELIRLREQNRVSVEEELFDHSYTTMCDPCNDTMETSQHQYVHRNLYSNGSRYVNREWDREDKGTVVKSQRVFVQGETPKKREEREIGEDGGESPKSVIHIREDYDEENEENKDVPFSTMYSPTMSPNNDDFVLMQSEIHLEDTPSQLSDIRQQIEMLKWNTNKFDNSLRQNCELADEEFLNEMCKSLPKDDEIVKASFTSLSDIDQKLTTPFRGGNSAGGCEPQPQENKNPNNTSRQRGQWNKNPRANQGNFQRGPGGNKHSVASTLATSTKNPSWQSPITNLGLFTPSNNNPRYLPDMLKESGGSSTCKSGTSNKEEIEFQVPMFNKLRQDEKFQFAKLKMEQKQKQNHSTNFIKKNIGNLKQTPTQGTSSGQKSNMSSSLIRSSPLTKSLAQNAHISQNALKNARTRNTPRLPGGIMTARNSTQIQKGSTTSGSVYSSINGSAQGVPDVGRQLLNLRRSFKENFLVKQQTSLGRDQVNYL